MNRWAGLAAGLMLAATTAAPVMAQEPPEGFVWYVLRELNDFGFDIEDPTNRPGFITAIPAGVLVPVDLNGDARSDWMIAWPDSAQFCGTGGCRRSLYMATDDGFRRVLDRQVLEMSIGRVEGEIRIEAQVHHLECGDRPEGCLYAWAWTPSMQAFDERPARDGWSRIPLAAPLIDSGEDDEGRPLLPDNVPDALYAEVEATRSACPAPGGGGWYWNQAEVRDTPDLNGDDRRDWLIYPVGTCTDPPERGFGLWVTGQGDSVALAYQAPPGGRAEFEVSHRPATVRVVPGCPTDESCPAVPLQWNAAEGRLVD